MRILLIGGNGFIGAPLAQQLLNFGHDLAILHRRRQADHLPAGVVTIQGDRNRLSDSREGIRKFSPDAIVDLILSSSEQAEQLLRVCGDFTPRIVALSSMDVYRAWGIVQQRESGELEPLPITEDSALRSSRTLYSPEIIKMMQGMFTWLDESYDKIGVEETIMRDSRVKGTIVRLPMVYGPGDNLHRFFPLLKRIADGRSAIIMSEDLGAWRGPRGYVENVAHAIALAATSDKAAGRIYNVCEEPAVSDLEWQKRIAAQLQWRGQFVVLPRERTPAHLLQPGNPAQHLVVSSARIRTELGYKEIVEIDEGIRRTAAWERENPPTTINPQQFDYSAEDAALALQS